MPDGDFLLATLVRLYADQCGLEIHFNITNKEET